jgi:hypothetical protein
MVVFEENKDYGSILDSASAPYINGLIRQCGLATNYDSVAHPSLPNYMSITSGRSFAAAPWSGDCSPATPGCTTTAASVFSETTSWRSYSESMPADCDRSGRGEYAPRHNPAVYYANLTDCPTNDVPLTGFAADVASGNLPTITTVTPNLVDDMHDGSIQQGDTWLADHLGPVFSAPDYRSGDLAVVIVWDESGSGGSGSANRVPLLVLSRGTPAGQRVGASLDDFDLAATIADIAGEPPLGSGASFRAAFGL